MNKVRHYFSIHIHGHVETTDPSRDSIKSIQDQVQRNIDLTPNGQDGFNIITMDVAIRRANELDELEGLTKGYGQGVSGAVPTPPFAQLGSTPETPYYFAQVPAPEPKE